MVLYQKRSRDNSVLSKLRNIGRNSIAFISILASSVFLLFSASGVSAKEALSYSEAFALQSVQSFDTINNNISKSQRWLAQVTNYDSNKKIISFGSYAYDSGTVRRVFNTRKGGGFVLISDGKISCERTLSSKFGNSLQADLKSKWICSDSGNYETVRLLNSFNPIEVMNVLSLATNGDTKFTITSTESNYLRKLVIVPSKSSNIKTSKLVFTSPNDFSINSKFFVSGTLSSTGTISPSSDKDFVTNLNDLTKVWK